MRQLIKDFIEIVSETLPIIEPIYEFGSLQVSGQEGFADLRPFFPGKEYVGCDLMKGPGVDCILDIHNIDLPTESVGTVIIADTLEHVEFPREAMKEVYRILKPNGIVIISSVMNFPIHNYPYDYWRFTPEGFRSILKVFTTFFIDFVGDENFPHTVIGIGLKSTTYSISLDGFKRRILKWKQYYTNMLPGKTKKGLYKGYGYHQEFRAKMGLKYKKALELTRADQSILEIGCNTGYFGEILKKRGNKIWGIEINREAANKAEPFYEKVIVGDIEDENLWNMIDQKFDVILFMDVLEHLVDPWRTLTKSRDLLNPEGFILITLPNIVSYRIRKAFFFGRFDYQESGILDATHLRFFTFNSARRLFEDCRYIINEWHVVESELPCEKRFPSISGFYNVIRPYLIKKFPNLFGSVILFKLLPREWI